MSPEIVGLLGIVFLVVFLFVRMWIGLAMGIIGFLGCVYLAGVEQASAVLGNTPYNTASMYTITAVPLFILMGMIIAETEIGADLYNTAYKFVGQLRGGLAMATILACAALAAITGLSAPAMVAMGKIALPEMRKYKYDDRMATGSIACAGTLAILIPPSLGFILYGILTEQSVGVLFMAGILPGILLTILFIITVMITTARNPQAGPPGPKTSFKEKIFSLKNTWHTLALFLLVIGGIYGGIFTPTEAGAVGAFGAIVIALCSRRLTRKIFLYSLQETTVTTAMVLLLVIGAFLFMKFLAISRLPVTLGELVTAIALSKYVIYAAIIVLYIILGMFLDIFSAIMLTIPIIYPIILAMGFDSIWYGVIMVLVMQVGLVTPPVGLDVYILSGITGVPVGTIFRGIWPFCAAAVICIILLTIFPQIALFLPSMM
jgi:C4-dicarboxylate transporter DctM subunit